MWSWINGVPTFNGSLNVTATEQVDSLGVGTAPTGVSGQITAANTILSGGAIHSINATAGIGYATGAGGSATQLTSKSTTVAFNAVTGQITTHNAALAAGAVVSFTFTNTAFGANDFCLVNHHSGGTAGAYTLTAQPAAGSVVITIRNVTAGSLSEAIVIQFAKLRGVIT